MAEPPALPRGDSRACGSARALKSRATFCSPVLWSSSSYLKTLFWRGLGLDEGRGIAVLDVSYRNSEAVTATANAVLKLKHARFGSVVRESRRKRTYVNHVLSRSEVSSYKPWLDGSLTGKVTQAHQACARMARAGYCGNGTSFTQDGTRIRLWDGNDGGITNDCRNPYDPYPFPRSKCPAICDSAAEAQQVHGCQVFNNSASNAQDGGTGS